MLASSLHEQTSGSTGPSKVRTLLALECGALKAPVLLTPGRWTIGCSAENHIVLQGPAVASRHGLIIASGKRVLFRSWSLDSRLNGVPVTDAELTAGQTLQIGLLELRLREAGSSELIAQLPAVAEHRADLERPVSELRPSGAVASHVLDDSPGVSRIDILAQAVEALSDELLGRDHGTQRLDELAGQIEASLVKPAVVRPDAAMTSSELARPLSISEAGLCDSSTTSSGAASDEQQVSKAELRFRRRYEDLQQYELRLVEHEEKLKRQAARLHRARTEFARKRRGWIVPDAARQDTPSSEQPAEIIPQASADDVSATRMQDCVESASSIHSECPATIETAAECDAEAMLQCDVDKQRHDEDLTEEQICFARVSGLSAVRPAGDSECSREEAVRQLDELLLSITGGIDADRQTSTVAPESAPQTPFVSSVACERPSADQSSDSVNQEIAATVERLQELEELLAMDLSDDITLESELAMTAGVSQPAANHDSVDDESDFQCGRLSLSLPGFEADADRDRPEGTLDQNHQPQWDDISEEDSSHLSQSFRGRGFVIPDDSVDIPVAVGERIEPVAQSSSETAGADPGDGSDEVIARSPLLASLLRSRPSADDSARDAEAGDSTEAQPLRAAPAFPEEAEPDQPVVSLRHQLASLFNMPEQDPPQPAETKPLEERLQSFFGIGQNDSNAPHDEPEAPSESSGPLASPSIRPALTPDSASECKAPDKVGQCGDEEPSIQDYMQQLLARSRRQSSEASPVAETISPLEAVVVETPAPLLDRQADADDRDKSWLEEGPLHTQDKKQVRERVAAFRDVANQSARAALISSRRRQLRIQVIVKSSAAVIALGSGTAALLMQLPKIFGYGVSALGLYFLVDLIVTLLRHGRKLIDYKATARSRARHSDAKELPERSPSSV